MGESGWSPVAHFFKGYPMSEYRVKIKQGGLVRNIIIYAKSSIDALTTALQSVNANEPSRVVVRAL